LNYWLLTTEYPPFYGGGIGTYCYFTAEMFVRQGHNITVFVPDASIKDTNILTEKTGITLVRFNPGRSDPENALGYTAQLSHAFADIIKTFITERGRPDFIEAQDYLGIAYYLIQFKHAGYEFIRDIPILITLHSPAFIYLEYNRVPTYRFPDFWTCEMEKQSIKGADMLLSPTRFLVDEIRKHMDISDKRTDILANPYETRHAYDPEQVFEPGKIVYYGKLSPQKGSFELLEYFRELWDDGFTHPLHIVGGTDIVFHPELRTMGYLVEKKYASYLEKGLLKLHGKIKPSQIKEYLSDAHVIVVPSIVDNMPYVILEAMSLGKVVLASVQGGQREMIEDDQNGFLFDHGEPSSFGRQLKKIISLPADRIRQIGKNAYNTVKDGYSPDGIYRQKAAILERFLSAAPGKPGFPFLYQEQPIVIPAQPKISGLLSVVIPYYNMGRYLEECLSSVFQSSYPNLEVIVVNDGSTDPQSISYLEKRAGGTPPIQVLHQTNRGLAHTRNEGARIAKGEFLAFLDADDKIAPSYYEKAIGALRQNENVFFVGSWVRYFENSHQVWPTFTPQPPYALVHNPVNSSGLVYKRDAFLAGGLNDKAADYGMEDYESLVSMLHHGLNGIVLPEVLFHYRVRSGSMFRGISTEKLLYSNKYITEKHSLYYAKFASQIINLLNANGPGYLFDNPTFQVRVSSQSVREGSLLTLVRKLVKRNEKLKRILLSIKNKS
jgi:glycosyltransferase involved in cell wall biosynthesis